VADGWPYETVSELLLISDCPVDQMAVGMAKVSHYVQQGLTEFSVLFLKGLNLLLICHGVFLWCDVLNPGSASIDASITIP
jgi:hypothetical protein